MTSIIFIIADAYIFGRETSRGILGRVLVFSVLESFGYRQMMSLFRIRGILSWDRNQKWGEMDRVKVKKEEN